MGARRLAPAPARFARLSLAAALAAAPGCFSAKAPPPGADACLADLGAGAGVVDWTARADAVVVGRVDVEPGPGGKQTPIVRVTEQWTGHPVENPFAIQTLPYEQELLPGKSWVFFLRRQGERVYARMPETASRPDLAVKAGEALGMKLDAVKGKVVEAVHAGEAIEGELKRLEFGVPPSRPFRVDYRVTEGDQSRRWVYGEGAVVRCAERGPAGRRALAPNEQRAFAGALRRSRFWVTVPSSRGEATPSERFHALTLEISGFVFTFAEPASQLGRAPALKAADEFLSGRGAAPSP
jgi:hypothetical protein